ncbi:MAG: DUF5317 domain-containing protein [Anaerolineae bacterium]
MILLLALAVTLFVAFLRGGSLRNLADFHLEWGWLAGLALALQIAAVYWAAGDIYLQRGALIASSLLLLPVVWRNRRTPGLALIGLGLTLNLVVMVANGGFMPVTPEAVARIEDQHLIVHRDGVERMSGSKGIVLPREETALWALSDIFVIPPPFPVASAFSLGDVLVAVGAFIFLQKAMVGTSPQSSEPRP